MDEGARRRGKTFEKVEVVSCATICMERAPARSLR
jgi:hypothetical protein